MESPFATSRDILLFDYEKKRQRNSRFSRRAYGKLLGISSGRLTEILNGKSPLTNKKAQSIVHKLDLDSFEQHFFLLLVNRENATREDRRRKPRLMTEKQLLLEEFALISDWEYFSLMSLIETSEFKSDKKWIAKKLAITLDRTEEVIARLLKLKLIHINDKGSYKNTYRSLSTLTDVPSEVLRKANTDCIVQALDKMNTIDVLNRDITSMTFPANPAKMTEAKELIREFKGKMAKLMSTGKTSEIYNLNVQLVPVSELGV
ncbi:MAG: DUF4423 domain-containing protein [Bacillota bacterium]